MTKYIAALGLVCCLGCSAAEHRGSGGLPTSRAFCEFSIHSQVPLGRRPIRSEVIPTEGDDRLFYDYRACADAVPVTVELEQGLIASIRIRGDQNCLSEELCIGNKYSQVVDRFPASRRFLSLEEGKTFALILAPGLTLTFDGEALPEECFAHPDDCDDRIQKSKVESIFLYSSVR